MPVCDCHVPGDSRAEETFCAKLWARMALKMFLNFHDLARLYHVLKLSLKNSDMHDPGYIPSENMAVNISSRSDSLDG